MADLGQAYVQIIPSAEGISGKIKEALGGEAAGAGDHAGGILGSNLISKLKGLLAAAGIGKILKDTIMQGAELEQNLGGTEAVFGEFASSIQASATEAYKNMGMSASDYMATANKMGSLFQGSGLEQTRALELTTQAMQRAADVASVMGIDTSAAMEAVTGAAKGNFTMMDNLGVAMNATTLQAYALEKGINFKWQTASNAQKAELAMQMFMERTAQYEGNFARESEQTLSGSLNAMKAIAQDVMGRLTLGMDVGPSLEALAGSVSTFIFGNLIPAVMNIAKALPGAAKQLISSAWTEIQSRAPSDIMGTVRTIVSSFTSFITQNVPGLMASGVEMLSGIITGMVEQIPELITFAGEMITTLLDTIIELAPTLLASGVDLVLNVAQGLAAAAPGMVTAAVTLVDNLYTFLTESSTSLISSGISLVENLVSGLLSAMPNLINSGLVMIVQLAATIMEHAPDFLASGIQLIGQLVAGIINSIPDMVQAAVQIGSGFFDQIMSVDWLGLGKSIVDGIVNGVTGAAGTLYSALKNLASQALESAKAALNINSPSRVFRDIIGKGIVEGIAVGIENNTGIVTGALTRMADVTSSGFEDSMSFGSGGYGRQVVVNQNIYAEAQSASDLMIAARYEQEKAVMGLV